MANVAIMGGDIDISNDEYLGKGDQNLPIERLIDYKNQKFGMTIHYGMSTFDGNELSAQSPISTYDPKSLDVDQWVRTAKEVGMQYIMLTTKHVSGFALWPSKYSEYSVKNAKDKTDVVGKFIEACRKYDIRPCFYYCAWDNTNLFGEIPTYSWNEFAKGLTFSNARYRDFMKKQIGELLTNYGEIEMMRIDMPAVLPLDYKKELYIYAKALQPNIVFSFNHSIQDGTKIDASMFWPSDVMSMERTIPNHTGGYAKKLYYNWKEVAGGIYYLPGEYNDTIGRSWFHKEGELPRDELDLLGSVLASTARGVRCYINCPPDLDGKMPKKWINALHKLKLNLDKVGFFEKNNLKVEKGIVEIKER